VGPRAGLDTEDKRKNPLPLPGIEPRSSGRPARSQTLYCLSYPAHVIRWSTCLMSRSVSLLLTILEEILLNFLLVEVLIVILY
jgi:hypothetical protein